MYLLVLDKFFFLRSYKKVAHDHITRGFTLLSLDHDVPLIFINAVLRNNTADT